MYLLEHHIEFLIVFKILNKLNYIRMSLAMMESLNFSKNLQQITQINTNST